MARAKRYGVVHSSRDVPSRERDSLISRRARTASSSKTGVIADRARPGWLGQPEAP